jgi:hypothetical protein
MDIPMRVMLILAVVLAGCDALGDEFVATKSIIPLEIRVPENSAGSMIAADVDRG